MPTPGDRTPLPPTRLISWEGEVLSADPDWQKGKFRPWWFRFSNGRTFDWDKSFYDSSAPATPNGILITESGLQITTEDGVAIQL